MITVYGMGPSTFEQDVKEFRQGAYRRHGIEWCGDRPHARILAWRDMEYDGPMVAALDITIHRPGGPLTPLQQAFPLAAKLPGSVAELSGFACSDSCARLPVLKAAWLRVLGSGCRWIIGGCRSDALQKVYAGLGMQLLSKDTVMLLDRPHDVMALDAQMAPSVWREKDHRFCHFFMDHYDENVVPFFE